MPKERAKTLLYVLCRCGHWSRVPVPDLSTFDRPAIVARLRCSVCRAALPWEVA